MKNFKFLKAAYLLAALAVFSSCDDDVFGIKGEGDVVDEYRSVSDFDAISAGIPGNIYLKQGEKEEILIEAQPNILDNIQTSVRNGELTIKFDRNVRGHQEINIYLTTPDIKEISLSGSGNLEGQNLIKTRDLAVSVSGSGDVDLEVETEELSSFVSGSGKIQYTGFTEDHELKISGSGDIKAFELESNYAKVRISGSGEARLFVNEELEAKISGSGDIEYKGSPKISSKISGSGKIRNAN